MSKRRGVLLLGAAAVAAGAVWIASSSKRTTPCPREQRTRAATSASVSAPGGASPVTLVDKTVAVPLTLVARKSLTHDTDLFTFGLPTPEHVLGLPTGQHVYLQTTVKGEKLERVYTPVSSDDDKGIMDMVIKLYRPNAAFPAGGKMSAVLDELRVGDVLEARGPVGRFWYRGRGKLAFKKSRKEAGPSIFHEAKRMVMLAGGSGITPMLQLIKHVLKDPEDDTQLELLFANKSEEDIMLRDQLDELAARHPDQFKVWYTVDKAPQGWKYSEGFINADMIKGHLSPPSPDTFVFMCGPKPMIEKACKPALEALGYPTERVHKF
ncbi:NADH-cytochrome b5 reductase 2 [Frankliniella fusca]|uniref:NADH-cytochrome b5 reductase n=1 Tax=Frankliniella fusca TaxID=407009 RepID=A0AAE1GR01_9NEOP|nr:NADH-cytochrome b5 reductase 2 [Frankliniella fusca]